MLRRARGPAAAGELVLATAKAARLRL